MAMDDAPDPHTLVRILASYLRNNPMARDSAEGIHRWWFSEGIAVRADELDKALRWMKHNGLIEETVAADGRVRYGRCCSDARLDALSRADNGTAAADAP